jgi:hypothetical protein
VAADTDGLDDVYMRSGGVTTLISAPGAGASGAPADASFRRASEDGTRVIFQTAESLVAEDTDGGMFDVYERFGGTTTLVSQPTGVADPQNNQSSFSGASADCTHVFFSTVQKLTSEDNDTSRQDIYDRSGGTTTLVSQPTGVADPNLADVTFGGNTVDGTKVYFNTTQKMVAGDNDTTRQDVYERTSPSRELRSTVPRCSSRRPRR